MSEEWESFPCQMGDDRAVILCNVGICDDIDTLPPHLLRLRIEFHQQTEDGMPVDEEFAAIYQFEDDMVEWLKTGDSHFIGRVTVGGHRHFLIATPEGDEDVWMSRLHNMPNEAGYDRALCTEANGVAEAYWNELYPGADDWQIIQDLKVINTMREHGDDGTTPRDIDHWAYFETEAAAEEFSTWATQQGYQFKESQLTEDGTYSVYLVHHGTLALLDITTHSITLMRQAEACGGEYDGWGSAIKN